MEDLPHEEVEPLDEQEVLSDPLFGAPVDGAICGIALKGMVVNVEILSATRQRLYLVELDDGALQHLTAPQVLAALPVGAAAAVTPASGDGPQGPFGGVPSSSKPTTTGGELGWGG